MRLRKNRHSSNIEDRRAARPPRMARLGSRGGLVRLLPLMFRFLGFKGTAIALAALIIYGFISGDLEQFLGGDGLRNDSTSSSNQTVRQSEAE